MFFVILFESSSDFVKLYRIFLFCHIQFQSISFLAVKSPQQQVPDDVVLTEFLTKDIQILPSSSSQDFSLCLQVLSCLQEYSADVCTTVVIIYIYLENIFQTPSSLLNYDSWQLSILFKVFIIEVICKDTQVLCHAIHR